MRDIRSSDGMTVANTPTDTNHHAPSTAGRKTLLVVAGTLTTLVALAVIAAMGALPVLAQDNRPLTASFVESTIPASHHGTAKNFTVRIQFSEPLAVSYKTLRDHALQVENGSSRRFKRVNGSNSLWEIHARPNSDEAVTLTLPATTDCDDTYAVCTADDKPFSKAVSITVPGPGAQLQAVEMPTPEPVVAAQQVSDSAAIGKPAITGTVALGSVLTADTSGITDSDGKPDDAQAYTYQWVRVEGTAETDITGATAPNYYPSDADVGKTIKVRVSYEDDANNQEGPIDSDATIAVPSSDTISVPWSATVTVGSFVNGPLEIHGYSDGTVGSLEAMGSLTLDEIAIRDGTHTVNYLSYGNYDGEVDFRVSPGLVSFNLLYGSGGSLSSANSSGGGYEAGGRFGYAWPVANPGWAENDRIAVAIRVPVNAPATGSPTITGTAELGQVLTADTSAIADEDGKPDNAQGFRYQWIRVDGMDETNIPGAKAPNYYPSNEDVGKTIKVKVRFKDDDGYPEGPLSSAATSAVPSSATIRVPWSTTMTSETKEYTTLDVRRGYDDGVLLPGGIGSLGATDFTVGAQSNTVRHILYGTGNGRIALMLNTLLDGPFALRYGANGDLRSTDLDASSASTGNTHRYEWISSVPDWDDADRIAVALQFEQALAAGLKITGSFQTGETLTADTADISDPNGLGTPTYTYQWQRVYCADSDDDGEISGETSSTYTVVATDLNCEIEATVTFKDVHGFEEIVSASTSLFIVAPATLAFNEGASGTYTVALAEQPTNDVTIDITPGGDLRVSPASLTFTSDDWNTAQTVTVSSLYDGDATDDTATITHAVASGSSSEYVGARVPSVDVAVTDAAADADVSWQLTLSRTEITEGDEGTVATLSITSDHRFAEDRTAILYWDGVALNEQAGTLLGVGSELHSTTRHEITIPAEQASGQATIKMFEDDIYERLSFGRNPVPVGTYTGLLDARVGSLSLAGVQLQITDNDPQPLLVLSVDDDDVTEGDTITLTTTLAGARVAEPFTFTLSATTPHGLLSSDYEKLIHFSALEQSRSTTVQFPDDATYEEDATITFSLAEDFALVGVGDPSEVTITVRDNDEPARLSLSVDDDDVTEGDTITLTASLTGGLIFRPFNTYLSATTPPGLLDSDYSKRLIFAARELSRSTTVQFPDDSTYQGDATITFMLSENEDDIYPGDPMEVTVTVRDNEEPPPTLALSVDDDDVTEGDTITLTVSLTGGRVTKPFDAYISATTPPGLLDSDYSKTLSFAALQRNHATTVQFPDDATYEGDATITFVLSENDDDIHPGDPMEVTVTVRDNEEPPPILVTNRANAYTESISIDSTSAVAQAFTTGAYEDGYNLTAVSLDLVAAPADPDQVTVSIYSETGGQPGSSVHTLTNPETFGSGVHRFLAPSGATLDPGTTYFVVVRYAGAGTLEVRVNTLTTETGETGWSIGDQRHDNPTWQTVNNPVVMELNGDQVDTTPDPPANLLALAGDGKVRLLWYTTGDASRVDGREYRQSDDGGDTWDPDWTDIPNSGFSHTNADSFTVGGLDNDATYTFQVRAENSAGHGEESAQATATPRGATDIWTATMHRADGCSNGRAQPDRCDNSAALSDDTFIFNGRDYQILSLTVNDYGVGMQIDPVFRDHYGIEYREWLRLSELDMLDMDERMTLHIGSDVLQFRHRSALNHGSYGQYRTGGRYFWRSPGLTGGNDLSGKVVKLNPGHGLAVDTTAPVLSSAVVDPVRYNDDYTQLVLDPTWVTLGFDEVLDLHSIPDPSAFTVTVNGEDQSVIGVSVIHGLEKHPVSGGKRESQVELKLNSRVSSGQVVTVSYNPPEIGMLRDLARNRVAGFDEHPVTNKVRR